MSSDYKKIKDILETRRLYHEVEISDNRKLLIIKDNEDSRDKVYIHFDSIGTLVNIEVRL